MLVAAMVRTKQHWLIKSEPGTYSFADLVRDKKTVWDGIRNYEARNNLRAMKKGDLCLFYHSNEGKAVIGIAEVVGESFQDATTPDDFSAVEIMAKSTLGRPVSLDEMRGCTHLATMAIFRKPRLSVVPLTKEHYDAVLELGGKKIVHS